MSAENARIWWAIAEARVREIRICKAERNLRQAAVARRLRDEAIAKAEAEEADVR